MRSPSRSASARRFKSTSRALRPGPCRRRLVEWPGVSGWRESRRLAEADVHEDVVKGVDPAGHDQSAGRLKLHRGEMNGRQRARAGGVNDAIGAAEIEAVGDPPGDDVARAAPERSSPARQRSRRRCDAATSSRGFGIDAGLLEAPSHSGWPAAPREGSPTEACR